MNTLVWVSRALLVLVVVAIWTLPPPRASADTKEERALKSIAVSLKDIARSMKSIRQSQRALCRMEAGSSGYSARCGQ